MASLSPYRHDRVDRSGAKLILQRIGARYYKTEGGRQIYSSAILNSWVTVSLSSGGVYDVLYYHSCPCQQE